MFVSGPDWSCRSNNDRYMLDQFSTLTRNFYEIPEQAYAANPYFPFLLRQLGLRGKKRKGLRNPIRFIRILLLSIGQYQQDVSKKRYFSKEVQRFLGHS